MEPEANVEEQGATEETPPSTPSTTALTVEGLAEALQPLIEQTVSTHVGNQSAALYRGMQSLLDSKINEIASQFGVDRETAVAMKAAARVQLGDEAFGELTKTAKQEQEAAQLRAEIAALKAIPAPSQRDIDEAAWAKPDGHQAELMEEARELDVDFATAFKMMKGKAIYDYPNKWVGWKSEFRRNLRALADAKVEPEAKKTIINSTRGSAAVKANSWADAVKITNPADLSYEAYEKLIAQS